MSQPLPTGGFKWVEVKPDKIGKLAKRKSKGYILEVDIQYPKELHDYHNYMITLYVRANEDKRN